MRNVIYIALVGLVMSAQTAWALDIDAAKSSGVVGEMRNGYIGAVKQTPEAQALVGEINAKRSEEYAKIAATNGQDLSVVEKLAAAKAYEMTAKGHYLKDAGGNWVKK
jgi:uncharacterized protein